MQHTWGWETALDGGSGKGGGGGSYSFILKFFLKKSRKPAAKISSKKWEDSPDGGLVGTSWNAFFVYISSVQVLWQNGWNLISLGRQGVVGGSRENPVLEERRGGETRL